MIRMRDGLLQLLSAIVCLPRSVDISLTLALAEKFVVRGKRNHRRHPEGTALDSRSWRRDRRRRKRLVVLSRSPAKLVSRDHVLHVILVFISPRSPRASPRCLAPPVGATTLVHVPGCILNLPSTDQVRHQRIEAYHEASRAVKWRSKFLMWFYDPHQPTSQDPPYCRDEP
jgi:hypothetical protein